MAAAKKVRVYDLARELKQDARRVIEDLRREGADVSVPSNSVSVEIAEKVKLKYFPKTETAPKRAVKVIKAVKREPGEGGDESIHESAAPEAVSEPMNEMPETTAPAAEVTAEPIRPTGGPVVHKVLKPKKPQPAPEVEPEAVPAAEEIPAVELPVAEEEQQQPAPAVEEAVAEQPVEAPAEAEAPRAEIPAPKPGGTQVKRLTLNASALQKGIKPGERVVSDAPTKAGKLASDIIAGRGRPGQFTGTPGEKSSPQTVYTPPADNRRRPGRSGGRKTKDARGGRFAERDFDQPKHKTIEERISDQLGRKSTDNFKQVRLVEGATVREYAEALGIPPRDIVQLLIKRGIFATVNQPIGENTGIEIGMGFGFDVTFVPFEEMVVEEEFEELIAADADDTE